jgi:hypothetical protein
VTEQQATTENDTPADQQMFPAEYVSQLRAEAAKHRVDAAAQQKAATEAQEAAAKVQQELDAARGEVATARLEAMRVRVGAKHQLPQELVDRLQGEDEASLEADAEKLAALIPKSTPPASTQPKALKPGAISESENKPAPTADEWLRAQLR